MGRPTKLNKARQAKIVGYVALGNYYEPACQLSGVGYSTFNEWMARGAEEKTGPYAEFRAAIKGAEAEAENRVIAMWRQQMPDNWQASATFLERRHPDRWGRKDRMKLETTDVNEHNKQVIQLAELLNNPVPDRIFDDFEDDNDGDKNS